MKFRPKEKYRVNKDYEAKIIMENMETETGRRKRRLGRTQTDR